MAGLGVAPVLTAPRSPWQNPYAERVIGSLRRECLDRVIVFSEDHLRRLSRDTSITIKADARTCRWPWLLLTLGRCSRPSKAPSSRCRKSVGSTTTTNGGPHEVRHMGFREGQVVLRVMCGSSNEMNVGTGRSAYRTGPAVGPVQPCLRTVRDRRYSQVDGWRSRQRVGGVVPRRNAPSETRPLTSGTPEFPPRPDVLMTEGASSTAGFNHSREAMKPAC